MKRCNIPSQTLGPCDDEWGHDGDMHQSLGDAFHARAFDARHHAAQRKRRREIADSADLPRSARPEQERGE